MTNDHHPHEPWDGDYDTDPQGDAERPRRSLLPWLLIGVLAVVAFAATYLFVGGGGEKASPVSAPSTVASQHPEASETSATDPSQSSTSSTDSPDSSSDSTTADFPSGYGTDCNEGDDTSEITDDDIRTKDGSGSSCAFVTEVKSKVIEYVAQNDGATDFSVEPYSAAKDEPIALSCQRENHLSHCTGGSSVDLYVRDNVG